MTKKCSKCSEIKPFSDFYKKGRKKVYNSKADYKSICRPCFQPMVKKYYSENKEAISLQKRDRFLKKHYKISSTEWLTMYEEQNGLCWICNRHSSNFKKGLVTDHNHKTGNVRGLLCVPCNLLIGYSLENIETLKNSIKYIEHFNSELADNNTNITILKSLKKVG